MWYLATKKVKFIGSPVQCGDSNRASWKKTDHHDAYWKQKIVKLFCKQPVMLKQADNARSNKFDTVTSDQKLSRLRLVFPASRGPFSFVFAELTDRTKRDLCHGSKWTVLSMRHGYLATETSRDAFSTWSADDSHLSQLSAPKNTCTVLLSWMASSPKP